MGPALDLDKLIADWRGPLLGLIASWGAPWGDAEVLAQDAFAEAWLARDRFTGSWDRCPIVGAWLRGIAFNLFRNWQRSRERRAGESIDEHDLAARAESTEVARAGGALAEEGERILHAMQRLTPSHRAVLAMVYLEDSGPREVAGLLGITPKAVESRLYHARKALKLILDADAVSATKPGARP